MEFYTSQRLWGSGVNYQTTTTTAGSPSESGPPPKPQRGWRSSVLSLEHERVPTCLVRLIRQRNYSLGPSAFWWRRVQERVKKSVDGQPDSTVSGQFTGRIKRPLFVFFARTHLTGGLLRLSLLVGVLFGLTVSIFMDGILQSFSKWRQVQNLSCMFAVAPSHGESFVKKQQQTNKNHVRS